MGWLRRLGWWVEDGWGMHNAWDCWATISLSAGSQPWPSNLGPVEIDGKRMFESTGQPWKPWNDDEWATALYRSWGVAGEHATEGSAAPASCCCNMVEFVDSIVWHLEVVSMNMIPTKMPYVWRSSFPIDSFCSSRCFHAPKDQGPWRHFARRCGCCPPRYGCHVAKLKLRNSALNPGVRRIKIAQTIRNMSKYPHIQVCKKYVKHYQTVGDCTCGRFRWAVCSACSVSPMPPLLIFTWVQIRDFTCETWGGELAHLFIFSLHVKVIYI